MEIQNQDLMDFNTIREIIKVKKNRNYKSKSVFNYIPYLLGDMKDYQSNLDVEWMDVEDMLYDLNDENTLKLFTSFLHSEFPIEMTTSVYFYHNIIKFIISSYYYCAVNKPHLMSKINTLIDYNAIEIKLKKLCPNYLNEVINDFSDVTYEARYESFMYLIENNFAENSNLPYYFGEEITLVESDLETVLQNEADEFTTWLYNIWKNTENFYGKDKELKSNMLFSIVEMSFGIYKEFLMNSFEYTEVVWYCIERIDELLGKGENGISNLALHSKILKMINEME